MKILIVGGDGMIGHQLLRQWRSRHDVRVTLRRKPVTYAEFGSLFTTQNAYYGVDVTCSEDLVSVFADFHPQAVINTAGIVKQQAAAKASIPSLEINALFPHRLAVLCKAANVRLVQLSTDCVFSGRAGNYIETDAADADDLYGKTKFLGEVHGDHCVTVRTSAIGSELSRKVGLLEWFLAQKGPVKGFKKAIYSGFTTTELSRIIERLLVEFPEARGLYHVSSDPISKYDLLALIKEELKVPVEIVPEDSFCCDRSLDSTRFRKEFKYSPPSWQAMIKEFADDFRGEAA